MKNFKFKLNFLSSLLKKNKIFKKIDIFLASIKSLFKVQNIKKEYLTFIINFIQIILS